MTTPYAKALVSLNGGGLVSGGQTVTPLHTVQLQGENTSGWRKSRWEIIGPPGWAVPAGWTDESGVAVYVGVTGNPPLWTLPSTAGWGKWIVTLIVNDGEKNGDAAHVDMRDATLALSMVSANGLTDVGTGEDTQFDAVRAWSGSIQALARQVDTALGLISGTAETVTLTGTVAIGDVVCSANDAADKTKVKLATTANLADAGAAGIRVMLEAGIVGQTKQAAGPGDIIAPSVLGFTAQTYPGDAVINTTTARASQSRVSKRSQWVLGHYDREGNTTLAPRKRGNGTHHNVTKFGAAGDGATDDSLALQAALDALASGDKLTFPPGDYLCNTPIKRWDGVDYGNVCDIQLDFEGGNTIGSASGRARLLGNFSDYTGACEIDYVGNGSGVGAFTADAGTNIITFAVGLALSFARVQFTTTGTLPAGLSLATNYWIIELSTTTAKVATTLANAIAGTAVDITDAGTGTHTLTVQATGAKMMRLKNPAGITEGLASEIVGLPCRVWNATQADDILSTTVTKVRQVGADVFMWVWNPRASASAPDYGLGGIAGAGKVRFRIERALLDLRCREVRVEGFSAIAMSGKDLGTLLRYTESPSPIAAGSTARTITSSRFPNIFCGSSSQTQKCRAGMRIGDDIVPTSNSSLSRFTVNGDGVPEVWAPFQVDVGEIYGGRFIGTVGGKFNGVMALGRAGQCERWVIAGGTSFNGCRNGWTVPLCTTSGSNLAHAEFRDIELGHCYDSVFDVSTTAFSTRIDRCQGEIGPSRLLNDRTGVFPQSVRITQCEVQCYPSTGTFPNQTHPSCELITTTVDGLIEIEGNDFNLGGDASKIQVLSLKHSQGASDKFPEVSFCKNKIVGTNGVAGRRGFTDARRRGPHLFVGTETLDVKIDGGATTTVTFSEANFNTALAVIGGVAYVVNMNEVRGFEVAILIEHFVGRSNCRAYAPEDDEYVRIYSNDTAGSSVQVTGGTANVQLDFNTAGIGSRTAVVQPTTLVDGLIQCSATGSSDEMGLAFEGNKRTNYATSVHIPLPHVRKYNRGAASAASQGPRFIETNGLQRPGSSVVARNFWKAVTHTGTTGTGTFTADAGTEIITFAAGPFGKFTKVRFTTTGTLPAGLALATDYWLIYQSATTAKVATSLANAIAGTAVNITDTGSGTHTATVQAGGSTFWWDFDTTEDDASYTPLVAKGPKTGTPAAGSDELEIAAVLTTGVVYTTTDPGSGNTRVWHLEMRR